MICTFLLISGFIAVLCGIVLKLYIKLNLRWNGCYNCLIGKTAIVTGANTGIGYITALDFAMRGARVILACRNEEKAQEARRKIVKETGNENVLVKIVDMQSFASVRAFAKDVNATEKRIDILVNNAGAISLGNRLTEDGIQVTMQTNHLSPFLLTHLLIDKLKASAPSRIVNVSSSLAKHLGRVDPEHMNEYPDGSESWTEWILYANTKLCNIMFTVELAKKLEGTGVTANSLNPGPIKTDIARSLTGVLSVVSLVSGKLFYLEVDEGAQTQIYVALSKDIEGVSGELFDNCQKVALYEEARDPVLSKKVWLKSEEFVRLQESEKL